jgi:ABC-2 type transport system permease protein
MRKLLSLMRFDLTNAVRDSMVVYVLVAPVLLAGILRLFLPSFEASVLTYALHVPPQAVEATETAERLAAYGRVERYDTEEAVRRRVLATDDVGGFVYTGHGEIPWRIVLEGNEDAESEALMQAVIAAAASAELVGDYEITKADDRSPFREYASVALVMLATLIGGLAVSFAMIDEKEQNVTRAFTVTPMSTADYFVARGVLAAGIGLVVATIGHLILVGTSVPFGKFLVALAVSAPLSLVVTLLVGGIAKNQIQAVAALKVVMMVYLTVPFVSIAVPRGWHWVFYVLPNYWMFRSFENVYVSTARSGDLPLAAAATAVVGAVTLVLLGAALGRQLKPQRA